jgi:streptogramin lyase
VPGSAAREWAAPKDRVPVGVAAGPDGALWATVADKEAAILRLDPATSKLTEYRSGLSKDSGPAGITAGPDGALWFTRLGDGRIGRITTGGTIQGVASGLASPTSITTGPDGALWFTESGSPARIGRLTTQGALTRYAVTPGSVPTDITAGPDGNLWFTEAGGQGAIGRITPTGAVTEFRAGLTAASGPTSIAAGPDGALWFTERAAAGAIGRITTAGSISEFRTGLTSGSAPTGIAAGADGRMWFTESAGRGRLGSITVPVPASAPAGGSGTTGGAGGGPLGSGAPGALPVTDPGSVTRAVAQAPHPVPGRTAVAGEIAGTVLVRRPGAAAPVALSGAAAVPVGSVIDTTRGTVLLRTALDRRGHSQTGRFWGGVFVVRQARSGGMTDLVLRAARPRCGTSAAAATVTARRAKRPAPRLWGRDHHGRFRTRGRESTATVRGTEWLVEERCTGTLTVVKRGAVSVRDHRTGRTVLVRAGHRHLARSGR